MDLFTVFTAVVFAVFLLMLIGLLVNAVLNGRPIYPKQPQGFDAIENAIDQYEQERASNKWQSPYSPYQRLRRAMNRRDGRPTRVRARRNTKSR